MMPVPTSESFSLPTDALGDFRLAWKKFALTSMVFKLIAVVLLTPLEWFARRRISYFQRVRFDENRSLIARTVFS